MFTAVFWTRGICHVVPIGYVVLRSIPLSSSLTHECIRTPHVLWRSEAFCCRGEHFLFVSKYTKRTSMVFRTTLLGAAAALAFAAPALGQTCTVDADCVGLDNVVDCTVGKCVASVCTSEDLDECLPTTPGCNNKARQQLMSVFEQELGACTVTCDDDYTEMFDADLDEYCKYGTLVAVPQLSTCR